MPRMLVLLMPFSSVTAGPSGICDRLLHSITNRQSDQRASKCKQGQACAMGACTEHTFVQQTQSHLRLITASDMGDALQQ